MDALSIKEWITMLTDVGVTICIVAIFLYVIIKLINIGFVKLNNSVSRKKHDYLIEVRSQVGEEVQILIEEFLTNHQGNSVRVIEFSNSVTSVAYLPFRYMTCTYEVCELGEPSRGSKIDRVSTSLFTSFFRELQKYGTTIFKLDSDDSSYKRMGGAMYDLMTDLKDYQSLCSILSTVKGKPIGYVAMQTTNQISKEDINDIKILARQLSALLCVVDN